MRRPLKYLVPFVIILLGLLAICSYAASDYEIVAPVPTPEVTEPLLPEEVVGPQRAIETSVEMLRAAQEAKEAEVIKTLDRNEPLYEVYKVGKLNENATVEIQWIIRDICDTYELPEKMIYGLILAESGFDAGARNPTDPNGGSWGLAQINKFWISGANITHFTDDYRSRDLLDPYDNMLTLAEIMCYARDAYGLDLEAKEDQIKYLYWHNTGQSPKWVTTWPYATRALGYADELVTLQSLDQ